MQFQRLGTLAAVAACITFGLLGAPGSASQAVHVRRTVKPTANGNRLGTHHIFGTIVAIDGNMLSVLRRDGKYIAVDATAPLANNNYSYPLFVGKTVAIDGSFASVTLFTALHVYAVTTLQSLEADQ